MQSKPEIMGTILDGLLPQELRVDADRLLSISTDSDFIGSANRYREQLGRARQVYSRIFFEPDSAHRSPSDLMLAQYYVSKRDYVQSALQLYTSAKNSRIPIKKLPFGAELIEALKGLNEIVDVFTGKVMVEKKRDSEARQKMRDDLVKEANGLIKRVQKAAGVKSGTRLPENQGKASQGLSSQRILSADEISTMLGNIVMTAESVGKSADALLASRN